MRELTGRLIRLSAQKQESVTGAHVDGPPGVSGGSSFLTPPVVSSQPLGGATGEGVPLSELAGAAVGAASISGSTDCSGFLIFFQCGHASHMSERRLWNFSQL